MTGCLPEVIGGSENSPFKTHSFLYLSPEDRRTHNIFGFVFQPSSIRFSPLNSISCECTWGDAWRIYNSHKSNIKIYEFSEGKGNFGLQCVTRSKGYHQRKASKHYLPSTFPKASTEIVWSAGMAHAAKWNKCDLFSMASWPHFKPAVRNQANAKHDHQANAAIQQKYKAIKRTVHDVDWRWP